MYPTDDTTLERIGHAAAGLLRTGPAWITRRKEQVSVLDETAVRRQMSVDFVLPDDVEPIATYLGEPVWYAPLFFLQKGSDEPYDPTAGLRAPEPHFANFDFRDEGGNALSLPPRKWNAAVTAAMLTKLVRDGLITQGRWTDDLEPGVRAIATEFCTAEQLRAARLLKLLREAETLDGRPLGMEEIALFRLDGNDRFVSKMLDVCTVASVVMVPRIGAQSRRGILKLSYDHQIAPLDGGERWARRLRASTGLEGYELWVDTPYIGASQHHFELRAPDGLEIVDAGLIGLPKRAAKRYSRNDAGRMLDRASGFSTRLHLYASPAVDVTSVIAWIRLRVRRHEFVGGALIAGLLVAAVLWVGLCLRRDISRSSVGVPTLLLLFSSVIAAYVARPAAHRITHRLLRGARWLVGTTAMLPFVAAGMLALAPRDSAGEIESDAAIWHWWFALATVASAIAVVLAASRIFPQPELAVRRSVRRMWRSRG